MVFGAIVELSRAGGEFKGKIPNLHGITAVFGRLFEENFFLCCCWRVVL